MPSRRRHEPGDPTKGVAVLRASKDEQRLTIQAQRRAIAEWAERNGVEVVAEHEDLGVSGTAPLEKRPGLLAAVEDLRHHGAGLLIIAKRDRLARSVVLAAVAERIVERAGAKIVSADGATPEDTPDGWLLTSIRDCFSQYEILLLRSRTRAALDVLRSQGVRLGGVPFGKRVSARDRNKLVVDRSERRTVDLAVKLRAQGMTLRAVATELDRRGRRPRGGGRWHHHSVKRILDREASQRTVPSRAQKNAVGIREKVRRAD